MPVVGEEGAMPWVRGVAGAILILLGLIWIGQ
jgi:hypothetical protein